MATILERSWWALAVRGLLAVLFGALAIAWPGITLAVLVLLFGAYALVDGIFAMVAAVGAAGPGSHRWLFVLEGLAGIAAGVLTFLWPGITAMVLLYLVAGWAFATGIFEAVAAVQLRQEIENEWLLGLSGVASVLVGLTLVAYPSAGALAVVWLIGAYALVFGALLLFLAFRLRGWRRSRAAPSGQKGAAGERPRPRDRLETRAA